MTDLPLCPLIGRMLSTKFEVLPQAGGTDKLAVAAKRTALELFSGQDVAVRIAAEGLGLERNYIGPSEVCD